MPNNNLPEIIRIDVCTSDNTMNGRVLPIKIEVAEIGEIRKRRSVPISRSSRNERPMMLTRKNTNNTV